MYKHNLRDLIEYDENKFLAKVLVNQPGYRMVLLTSAPDKACLSIQQRRWLLSTLSPVISASMKVRHTPSYVPERYSGSMPARSTALRRMKTPHCSSFGLEIPLLQRQKNWTCAKYRALSVIPSSLQSSIVSQSVHLLS